MKKILFLLIIAFSVTSCGDFTEINTNPDASTKVPSEFLATQLIKDMTACNGGGEYFNDSWLVKTSSFTERSQDYLYNKFNRVSYDSYTWLMEGVKMVELSEANESLEEGRKNAFKALNLFAQSFFLYELTMSLGDIPCSEALKGEEGVFMPVYDEQEQVFVQILDKLTEASSLFGNASELPGDIIFDGDVNKWQRATNSFMLRVLNMLSDKSTVGGKDVKQLFEECAAKPLIDSEDNSLMRTFDEGKSTERHPFYEENSKFGIFPILTDFLIKKLKDTNDPRLFYYGEPTPNAVAAGMDPSDPNAYAGPNPVEVYAIISQNATNGQYSSENLRYWKHPSGEPYKAVSYSETEFILSEAAVRGWKTPASAKTHYENGVRAAMEFTGKYTPSTYNHGVFITSESISSYLSGTAAFNVSGTKSQQLEQIMDQKLIASFLQLRWNSYFDYRRTGYPVIPIDPKTNKNEVKDRLPTRWMYPEGEYSQNGENLQKALERQYGGSDDTNKKMWLLK